MGINVMNFFYSRQVLSHPDGFDAQPNAHRSAQNTDHFVIDAELVAIDSRCVA